MFLRSCVLISVCLTAAPASGATVIFEDRREQAGIDFLHQAGRSDEKFLIETMGGGVGLLDYNGDGLLDIFFLNSGGLRVENDKSVQVDRSSPKYLNKLYRNLGNGTFDDVTEKAGVAGAGHSGYGMGVATGDFDNDGFTDLYACASPKLRSCLD